jgi:hypothetical protein
MVARAFPVFEFRHGHIEDIPGFPASHQFDYDGPELFFGKLVFYAVDPSCADDQVSFLAGDSVIE